MSDPCDQCNGSRHRWDPAKGRHVRCECLRTRQAEDRYVRAGVPRRFESETWRSFLKSYEVSGAKAIVTAARDLARGGQPKSWILVSGRPEMARQIAVSLTLRSACDGHLTAKSLDVSDMIDAEFQRGEASHMPEIDVLVIQIGNEPVNKWHKVVLEKALRERWAHNRFTLLSSDLDPSRIATTYTSALIEEAMGRFSRVCVEPK